MSDEEKPIGYFIQTNHERVYGYNSSGRTLYLHEGQAKRWCNPECGDRVYAVYLTKCEQVA